ncbi:hypothetical protein HAL1_04963 [Halomonas sp. HAL1]|nr:hypothetical protein HAL1_04963 [Halomonas sp. HAL1]
MVIKAGPMLNSKLWPPTRDSTTGPKQARCVSHSERPASDCQYGWQLIKRLASVVAVVEFDMNSASLHSNGFSTPWLHRFSATF